MSSLSSLKAKKNFLSIIISIYVTLIGMGLPIIVGDQYFDILLTKYYFYWICTAVMVVLAIIYIAVKGRDIFIESIKKKMMIQDYAALIFLLIAFISTLSSEYLYESFWGNEGRFTGLFLLSLYVLSYFFVSRFWIYKPYYIDGMLTAGILVCLFGITDYFQMDILGFKENVIQKQLSIFTSTIGNINTYTAYVGIITAIATVLFTKVQKGKRMILYYLCMIISFFAIIMGVSDNAYLSLAALFGLLPLYLFSNRRGVKRYLVVLATFFSTVKVIAWINNYFRDQVIGIDSVFNIIAGSRVLLYLVFGLWSMIVIWYIMEYIKPPGLEEYGNVFRYIWLVFILLVILTFIYVTYDCNILGNSKRYGTVGSYLLFNDDWGTHRGYIWRNALEQFSDFSLFKKLIGYGPETFGILLMHKTYNNPYNQTFDSAHNEYLQFLLTVGIVGLISYLTFILSCIKESFSSKNKNPYIIAMTFGVICYSVQAFVNLNLPIVTPVFWVLLGMITSACREK